MWASEGLGGGQVVKGVKGGCPALPLPGPRRCPQPRASLVLPQPDRRPPPPEGQWRALRLANTIENVLTLHHPAGPAL